MFGAPASPFSQPRNAIGGQLIAVVVGVVCRLYIAGPMGTKGLALPLSVSVTLFLQYVFRALNPPAGGTSALVVISSPVLDRLGWGVLVPVLLESCYMVMMACIVINLHPDHRYPRYWFFEDNACCPERPAIPPEWKCACCATKLPDPAPASQAPWRGRSNSCTCETSNPFRAFHPFDIRAHIITKARRLRRNSTLFILKVEATKTPPRGRPCEFWPC
jgi:hypothetical protein